jgi:toxin-antitoxin system PIN domain toxin
VKSIDTNILLYAVNRDCPEHEASIQLVEQALKGPRSWIIADQVWFELYRLLRNPAVLGKPLSAGEAAHTIEWYRQRSGWLSCAWEPDMMPSLLSRLKEDSFPARSTFDLVLAVTLQAHGVELLYSRNTRGFAGLHMFDVRDPLVEDKAGY